MPKLEATVALMFRIHREVDCLLFISEKIIIEFVNTAETIIIKTRIFSVSLWRL
jgi:hypothetical protein